MNARKNAAKFAQRLANHLNTIVFVYQRGETWLVSRNEQTRTGPSFIVTPQESSV